MFIINLELQHSVYTFDTACFYTDEETALDRQLQALRAKLADDKRLRAEVEKADFEEHQHSEITGDLADHRQSVCEPDNRARLRKIQRPKRRRRGDVDANETIEQKRARLLAPADIKQLNKDIREAKDALKGMIEKNMEIDRCVRSEAISPVNIVSIFDSNLTRALNMSSTEVNDTLVIVKVYYFGVAENIIKRGFYMNGEHYVFFSASAGQIRTKKFVAIKESAYGQCQNSLTCGLSAEDINASGGVNINKYLAYLALCNSATTPWEDFPIERTIVVDDFETLVPGIVDYIDEKTYTITRQQMDVPITHTDGCGMILPSVSKINFMVRAPWVKGLLASFPFDKFIREANRRAPKINHGLIVDIYGRQHDVLAEGIQIILTKSMFKMAKYYSSWEEYQDKFRRYGCAAGKCNEEPARISNAKFNYQMLQTLTDLSDEELEKLCEPTNRKLRDMASDRQTMLQVFGATPENEHMNAMQKCLIYYPELLQDMHCREILRDMKNSIELQAVAGRLDIEGKYLFLLPDLYAACQHWFLHEKTPSGLLQGDDVACRIYRSKEKMDVLRSPHLYREHFVAANRWSLDAECQRWFQTDGIYTSSHSLCSKILQFDKRHC